MHSSIRDIQGTECYFWITHLPSALLETYVYVYTPLLRINIYSLWFCCMFPMKEREHCLGGGDVTVVQLFPIIQKQPLCECSVLASFVWIHIDTYWPTFFIVVLPLGGPGDSYSHLLFLSWLHTQCPTWGWNSLPWDQGSDDLVTCQPGAPHSFSYFKDCCHEQFHKSLLLHMDTPFSKIENIATLFHSGLHLITFHMWCVWFPFFPNFFSLTSQKCRLPEFENCIFCMSI